MAAQAAARGRRVRGRSGVRGRSVLKELDVSAEAEPKPDERAACRAAAAAEEEGVGSAEDDARAWAEAEAGPRHRSAAGVLQKHEHRAVELYDCARDEPRHFAFVVDEGARVDRARRGRRRRRRRLLLLLRRRSVRLLLVVVRGGPGLRRPGSPRL